MGKAHGETAAQDTRGLRGMPSRHSRRAHSRVTHGVVTGEPVAGNSHGGFGRGLPGKGPAERPAPRLAAYLYPGNQRPCRRVRTGRWEDPRDMAKARLPEP